MNTKAVYTDEFITTILGECESIISCVENVQHMSEGNTLVVQLLEIEDFENIRTTAEELQTLVVQGSDIGDLYDESVTLYQNVKYTLEALEDSIQDLDLLNEFGFIRAALSVIRTEINTLVL